MSARAKAPTWLRICAVVLLAASTGWSCRDVEVTALPVASVAIVPTVTKLPVGERKQLRAVASEAGGAELSGRAVRWSVKNPAVATVDSTGRIEAVTSGATVVQAHSGDAVGEAWVEVTSQRQEEAGRDEDGPGRGEGEPGAGGESGDHEEDEEEEDEDDEDDDEDDDDEKGGGRRGGGGKGGGGKGNGDGSP